MLCEGFVCQQGVCLCVCRPAGQWISAPDPHEESEECLICEGDNLKSAARAFFGQEIRATLPVSAACACVRESMEARV